MRHSLRSKHPGGEHVATSSHGTTPESFGKEGEHQRDGMHEDDGASVLSEKQAGVKRIEAVSKSWTRTSLIVAYVTCVDLPAVWHGVLGLICVGFCSLPMSRLWRFRLRGY
jgi:hypothetical protein